MTRENTDFTGLWVALATPFDRQGELDLAAYRRLIRFCLDGGVQGLVALGSTGEAATLLDGERDRVLATCLEENEGQVPVLAGAGANSTRQAAGWGRRAAELGADGLLVVTPFYNKPNDRGLLDHYAAISDAAPLPIVAYNVPGRTGLNLRPELLERLWRQSTVVAVKESSGDLGQIDTILRPCLPAKKCSRATTPWPYPPSPSVPMA